MTDAERAEIVTIVDSELSNIEVDERGCCRWTDVANALTHIQARLRLKTFQGAAVMRPTKKVMAKPKKINCKWCGMGHAPRPDGNHWIATSIMPDARLEVRECAYHKAGTVSPIQQKFSPIQDEAKS